MLIGRAYRKAISQSLAFIIFRWVAIWVLIGACVSQGEPIGTVAALVIIAADIVAYSVSRGLSFALADRQRKQWMDTLTNRTFYRLFWEAIRESGSNSVDIDELFRSAEQEAVADIKKAEETSRSDDGWLDSTTWHWFGGLLSFVGQVVSYLIYYGSAFWLFSKH